MSDGSFMLRIVSSFTATPIGSPLTFWAERLGLPVDLSFAAYGQVFQDLQRDHRDLNAVAVLLRMEDFVPPGRHDKATSMGAELATAVVDAAGRTPSTAYFVAVCPPSAAAIGAGRGPAIEEAARELRRLTIAAANISYVDPADVLQRYAVPRAEDTYADKLGNIPYTPECFAALGTTLMRRLYRTMTPEPKVLVVDADGTLWDGVLGEDGIPGIRIGLARQEIQDFLIEQRGAGRLLCLSSKNDPDDIIAALTATPGMRLSPDDFVRVRANWKPKSAHVKELAADLGLALESFVFIDDSPVECAEVRSKHPEVTVLQLAPDATRALQSLRHCWPLDIGTVTIEAGRRTAFYHAEGRRQDLRRKSPSLAEFIDGLELTVTVRPATAADRPRMADLMLRTTQFNLTGQRYGAAEIESLPATVQQYIFEVRDRFGDYGAVGLVMASAAGDVLDADVFLLSCRALGRGVEHHMLAEVGRLALDQGFGAIRLRYTATARNQPAWQFLSAVGVPEGGVIGSAEAAETRYTPNTAPDEDSPSTPRVNGEGRRLRPWPEVIDAANDLTTARGLRKAMARLTDDPRAGSGEELAVRQIWAEVLKLDVNGLDGDFRSLGGGSMELVQLLAGLYEEFGVELPVEALLDTEVTVDGVVDLVQLLQCGQSSTGIPWVEL
jgi:FkbH-like protein